MNDADRVADTEVEGIDLQVPRLAVDLRSGDRLNQYTIEDELGRGGMGITYACRNDEGERFALKIAGYDPKRTHNARDQLERDAELASLVAPHPAVARVYEMGEAVIRGVSVAYLRSELVAGPPISRLLESNGVLAPDAVRHLWVAVAEGLAAIHKAGVLHLDLKPANLLLDRTIDPRGNTSQQVLEAMPKIIDFGISRQRGDNAATSVGVEGTPFYMSPEQCEGVEPSPASDIYTLGVAFFHIATGTLPFSGEQLAVLHKHVHVAPPLAELDGRLGYHLSLILSRCLLKNPADRYPGPSELLVDLCAAGGRDFAHRELEYRRDHEILTLSGKVPRRAPGSSGPFERFQGESFTPLGQLLWLFSKLGENTKDLKRALEWLAQRIEELREVLLREPNRVSLELDVVTKVLIPRLRSALSAVVDRSELPDGFERDLDTIDGDAKALRKIGDVRAQTLLESWQVARTSLAQLKPLEETGAQNRLVRVRVERDLDERVTELRWDLEEIKAKIGALLETGDSKWAAQELLAFERRHPHADVLAEISAPLDALRALVSQASG